MAEFRFTKWGGRLHWHYPIEPLGVDAWGTWFGTRAGLPMRRGSEPPVTQPHDFVTLVPIEGWYVASYNGESDHGADLYIDISTPPTITADLVEAVDLDLDVIRTRDGRILIDDEDEFLEHQLSYAYPPHVIEAARTEADRLLAEVTAAAEPFGEVGRAWLARYASTAGGT